MRASPQKEHPSGFWHLEFLSPSPVGHQGQRVWRKAEFRTWLQWKGKTTETNGAWSSAAHRSLAAERRTCSFLPCVPWSPPSATHTLFMPWECPCSSYCCGCSLSFLHERQEVCHVAFLLRLSLLRGWEELSEQTFWLRPPAKHSTCWRGSHTPAVGSHRHFVKLIFKGFLCASLSIPGNGTNRCVSLTQEMLQGLCF